MAAPRFTTLIRIPLCSNDAVLPWMITSLVFKSPKMPPQITTTPLPKGWTSWTQFGARRSPWRLYTRCCPPARNRQNIVPIRESANAKPACFDGAVALTWFHGTIDVLGYHVPSIAVTLSVYWHDAVAEILHVHLVLRVQTMFSQNANFSLKFTLSQALIHSNIFGCICVTYFNYDFICMFYFVK